MSDEVRAIEPLATRLDAHLMLPGSKSETNRVLVCAALAAGRSVLDGVLDADDTRAMVDCLQALGARIEPTGHAQLTVEGVGGTPRGGPVTLDARMSGTTARFVAPVAALGTGRYQLTGHAQMQGRPMAAALDALRALGVGVEEDRAPGHLPVTIVGDGGLDGGEVAVPGDVSSQFLSGLLLVGPAMRHGLVVTVDGELVSKPYVDLTVACMESFGATVTARGGRYEVAPGGYQPAQHLIEPDASAASYFFAAAAMTGGVVRVAGLGAGSRQGDLRFVDILEQMGAQVTRTDDATVVAGPGRGELRGVDVDLSDLSDTAPTLAVVASQAYGPTRVRGIGFIRRKESDRINAVVTELQRCGVSAEERPDGFVVHGRDVAPAHGARIETYDDHRIAMSFAVLGLLVPGIEIVDPGCVAKTFPDYFEYLESLRLSFRPG